jgi:hypothetical protein
VISDVNAATKISKLVLEANRLLNEAISIAQEGAANDEFSEYQRRTGFIMYSILEQLLEPIYRKHPEIKPTGLEL